MRLLETGEMGNHSRAGIVKIGTKELRLLYGLAHESYKSIPKTFPFLLVRSDLQNLSQQLGSILKTLDKSAEV